MSYERDINRETKNLAFLNSKWLSQSKLDDSKL